MNYISGAFRYVARGESETQNNVPRLVDRIKTSSLPQDRRSAIIQLTEAAKTSLHRQTEVGELGIKVLYAVLEQDVEYDDTIKAALELLIAICGRLDPPPASDYAAQDSAQQTKALDANRDFERMSSKAAATNVDMFLGWPNSLSLLLQLLEKGDFYVKFGAIELLTAMVANSRQTLQMAALEAPQGVTRICDLLDDSHRHIRSNAVLLLSTLCDQSPEICKIIAFGGALEKLFSTIDAIVTDSDGDFGIAQGDSDEEDSLEAAIVVQDVLNVVRNLIIGTKTTKSIFRDTGCLNRLVSVIQRAAVDADMLPDVGDKKIQDISAGPSKTIQRQAKKNLVVALDCITGLVEDNDVGSALVKSDLCNTKLLRTLAHVAFFRAPDGSKGVEVVDNELSVRVAALRTMAGLVRGHDEMRQLFGSESCRCGSNPDPTVLQVATMNAMLRDPSAAIRIASYSTLRASFVADSGLDLPSSAFLTSMVGAGAADSYPLAGNMSHRTLSSGSSITSPNGPAMFVAASLKEVLVGWQSVSDAAGVFYAASLISWLLSGVKDARERLLSAHVNGNPLLPQIIRVLGKLERERGPPEVRISLFELICVWLYRSPSAVSAFLSSAMHLPMLIDILKSTGSRGDVAEVHTRGLSAVILGICLQASDGYQDVSTNGSFLSGIGPSTVIPGAAVADVIRNRIGITIFTSCLDDVKATKAFSSTGISSAPWKLAENLIPLEEGNGLLCVTGSLGHENWYTVNAIEVVNDVYKTVGERALDLVADSKQNQGTSGREDGHSSGMNGLPNGNEYQDGQQAVLADSERDEVISSYKEFIRTQDQNLSGANIQIAELTAALRQAQVELDKKSESASGSRNFEQILTQERDEMVAQKDALEGLLTEKSADFEALSNAFASLEADQMASSQETGLDNRDDLTADVQRLRSQNEAINNSLESEAHKNEELTNRITHLEEVAKSRNVELTVLTAERDSLRMNVHPEIVEALQWRTRAEVAESKIHSRQKLIDSYQNSNINLQEQLGEIERTQDEALASAASLTDRFNTVKTELENLRATRKREIQVSREATAASDASAINQIALLQDELADARDQHQNNLALQATGQISTHLHGLEQMQSDYQAVLNAYEKVKTELTDAKQAVLQWQTRAEASETARQRDGIESNRIANHAHNLEAQFKALNDSFLVQTETSEASTRRVSELEQQCKEIDEIRKHTEEELVALKEQLASRTEQSIRLSGQLYEIEESRAKLEEEIEVLRVTASAPQDTVPHEHGTLQSQVPVGSNEEVIDIGELRAKLAVLEKELETTKEELTDSKDRESLSQAQARDRDAMVAKVGSLEQSLSAERAEKERLEQDTDEMRERLLSLDEAEEAKRALTMQVVALQDSVSAIEREGQKTSSMPRDGQEKLLELQAELERLRSVSVEKDMRLQGLETSLTSALDRADNADRGKKDMGKQVAESEAMFSVLQSERNRLTEENGRLARELEEIAPLVEEGPSHVEELQSKLAAAEQMRDAASKELASLVAACKVSEEESNQLKDDSIRLNESLCQTQKDLSAIQKEYEDFSLQHTVDDVVNSILLQASLTAEATAAKRSVEKLKAELAEARASCEKSKSKLEQGRTVISKVPILTQELNEAVLQIGEQNDRIAELSEELVGLQLVSGERDRLASSLNAAKANVQELTTQNSVLSVALDEMKSHTEIEKAPEETEGSPDHPDGITIHQRVQELEEALRDAAKTVTITNGELVAAQSLLVDLSADKTAIRTELAAAQVQINQLVKQVANFSRSSATIPALSEVSEQDQSANEDTLTSSKLDVTGEAVHECLQSAQAEASNLRAALHRSIVEADTAAELVVNIESTIDGIEKSILESRDTASTSQEVMKTLQGDLERLHLSHEQEIESSRRDVSEYKARTQELEREVDQTKENWKEKLSFSEKCWSASCEKLDKELLASRTKLESSVKECMDLQKKVEIMTEQLEESRGRVEELEMSEERLSSSLNEIDQERANLQRLVEKTEHSERNVKETLRETKAALLSAKDSFASERKQLEEMRRAEVKDLEDELDRASTAMESTERTFRDSEGRLKEQLAQETVKLQELEQKHTAAEDSLRVALEEAARITREKEYTEKRLSEGVRERDVQISTLKAENQEGQSLLAEVRGESDAVHTKLEQAERVLQSTNADLKEEEEHKAMLESENQDLLTSIESLESTSKRIRTDFSQKTRELVSTETRLRDVESELRDKSGRADEMEKEIGDKESEIGRLTAAKCSLESVKAELRDKLKKTEDNRDALGQDNKDLLAWVSDLEKQATEMQSAACDFQEVEQNLRDALDSQRYSSEQNSKLVEELRHEKVVVSSALAKTGQAIREKEAAEGERDSAKRRAQEVEARIREIREKNVVKFSNSEEATRAKAKQCAELETALATSERRVAELESVSDELFGATSRLRQVDEDMKTFKERALSAEETGDVLRKELQAAQAEMSAIREKSSGEAWRSLEAEHNELLIYLADLELEVTSLKEEVGRE